ncbi:MAG: hypothetical protein KDK37_14040, partial [Leptospiraceae bacterium]|nr:hypothetical protein [Leptospiraceae bacterium]
MHIRPVASRLIILGLIFGFTVILWAAPAGPEGYVYLGKEGESVVLKERASVAYGANGTFAYKHNVDPGQIELSNATFGDPLPGVPKFGFYRPGSSAEFDETEILKEFPLVKPDLIRSMLLARPGVTVEGKSDQAEKMEAYATIDGATVALRLSTLGAEYSGNGKVMSIAFAYRNSSNEILDIWTDQNKVKKIFETFLSPRLANRMFEEWKGAKQSYEGVEYGRNAQHDIFRRTGLTPANTRQPNGIIEFSKSSTYTSVRANGKVDSFSGKPELDYFEIRRGIATPFTVFMIHAFSPEGDIVATQEALKQRPTAQEVQESQKPYVYGKVEKRRLKADPRMQYYIYIPAGYKPEKTYDLILTFHGDGGSGRFFANAFAGMAQKDNFIVLSPNYGHSGERDDDFEQMEAGDAGLLFEDEIREHFKLNPKTYLVSFSAGGLYA